MSKKKSIYKKLLKKRNKENCIHNTPIETLVQNSREYRLLPSFSFNDILYLQRIRGMVSTLTSALRGFLHETCLK